MTAADRSKCYRYAGTCPADRHLYGRGNFVTVPYCDIYCSERHRLRRFCNYLFYILYLSPQFTLFLFNLFYCSYRL